MYTWHSAAQTHIETLCDDDDNNSADCRANEKKDIQSTTETNELNGWYARLRAKNVRTNKQTYSA